MMQLSRTISAVGAVFLLLLGHVCHGQMLVETCEELQEAFALAATEDLEIMIDPFQTISCDTFTTMSMTGLTLQVFSSDFSATNEGTPGGVRLDNIRFEVTDGAKLFWFPSVTFIGTDDQDVNGGALFVGDGSTIIFENDLSTENVGVASVTAENMDFAGYTLSGGCVYTDGYLVVKGDALFEDCENSGGGESSAGPGGAVYVGETGSVLFEGTVTMRDVSIIDNDGDDGAGFHNRGKVNIKGNALFERLTAEFGGAIFNTEGAEFRFKRGATAVFIDCRAQDGIGGAVYNAGYLKFSGPSLVLNSRAPTFVVTGTGYTRLSEGSVFWGGVATSGNVAVDVLVEDGGRLTGAGKVSFVNGPDSACPTVFYEDGSTCL